MRSSRITLGVAAVALASGLLVEFAPVLGKELDETALAGEYSLRGEEDDDTPIETTLAVCVTDHHFEVTRTTTLPGTGTKRVYKGTATRKKDKLEVDLWPSGDTTGFTGAIDGEKLDGQKRRPIHAELSFKSKGRVKGELENKDRIDGWKEAKESGQKKGLPDEDAQDDDDKKDKKDGDKKPPTTVGGAELTRGPYVQNVVGGSATIVWRTSGPTDSVVEFGPSAALGSTAGRPDAKETTHVVTLTGLPPGQPCFYRVLAAGQPLSGAASFKTAAPAGTAFRFLAFGDSGSGTRQQFDLAAKMTAEVCDFVLHTGDVVYPDGAAKDYDDVYFKPYRGLGATHCVFPAIGNHDARSASSGYLASFFLPANNPARDERYYSFDWGDAHFVSIDTSSGNFSGPAVTWLRQDLAQNTRRWTVVFMHIPLYSGGMHGESSSLKSALQPIFEEFRVPLVVQGHDHDYQRSVPLKKSGDYPGTTYVVTGGGGKEARSVSKRSWTAKCESVLHYTLFTVGSDAIAGRAVALDGHTVDEFRIALR
ncbi:MAG: metallophosphoesterase [Planctomycetota bacterium]